MAVCLIIWCFYHIFYPNPVNLLFYLLNLKNSMLENLASLKLVLHFCMTTWACHTISCIALLLRNNFPLKTLVFVPLAAVHEALSVILHIISLGTCHVVLFATPLRSQPFVDIYSVNWQSTFSRYIFKIASCQPHHKRRVSAIDNKVHEYVQSEDTVVVHTE